MPQRFFAQCLATAAIALTILPAQAETAAISPVSPVLPVPPIERALSCSDASNCPYFPEVYEADRAFREALLIELKKADIRRPSWVPNGVTTPLRRVEVDGNARLLTSVCEPHNCGHYFLMLYDPANTAITGLYVSRDEAGALQTQYFGRPSIAEAALLKNN